MNNKDNTITVNNKSFTVLKLLGKGKGGYSYLVEDNDSYNFVVKQIHHEPCEYYNFGNKIESELNDYKRLQDIGIRIPKMLDVDIANERILKEYINGDTIYDLVKNDQDVSIYIIQLKEMCSKLYPSNTNIDYFLDYECNNYMDEWNFENWGIKYWSKTPEFVKYMNNH